MKRRKQQINNKNERVVLSDILPFEMPVTFSNRQFYSFLIKNGVKLSNGKISWSSNSPGMDLIIKLLFGLSKDKVINNCEVELKKGKGEFRTIPFRYKISHKENDFRELVVIHPNNQLQVIEFYKKFKELILMLASKVCTRKNIITLCKFV